MNERLITSSLYPFLLPPSLLRPAAAAAASRQSASGPPAAAGPPAVAAAAAGLPAPADPSCLLAWGRRLQTMHEGITSVKQVLGIKSDMPGICTRHTSNLPNLNVVMQC